MRRWAGSATALSATGGASMAWVNQRALKNTPAIAIRAKKMVFFIAASISASAS